MCKNCHQKFSYSNDNNYFKSKIVLIMQQFTVAVNYKAKMPEMPGHVLFIPKNQQVNISFYC